jgi:phosphopantetheinyl transferase (holo-ACP synthase)
MRLGNDIVDLKFDAHIHPRFVSRILHPMEKLQYPGLVESKDIWAIWAAKEAAFKAYRQGQSANRFFIPNRWRVDLLGARVLFEDESYLLNLEFTQDYIYAIARSEDFPFVSRVVTATLELSPEEQCTKAQELRSALNLPQTVQKDKEGIPRLSVPYSLTHHGRHIAVAHGCLSTSS